MPLPHLEFLNEADVAAAFLHAFNQRIVDAADASHQNKNKNKKSRKKLNKIQREQTLTFLHAYSPIIMPPTCRQRSWSRPSGS